MPVPIIAAAIAAAASITNSIIQSRRSKKNQDKQNQENRALAEYQYAQDKLAQERANQYNMEMWNKSNEYNDPQQQMIRLQEAGLNPNLAYSSGNVGGMSSGRAPESETVKYQAPRAEYNQVPFQLPQMIGMYQDFQMKNAQIDNVKAQTEAAQQATTNNSLRQLLLNLEGQTGEFKLKKLKEMFPGELSRLELSNKKGELDLARGKFDLRSLEQMLPYQLSGAQLQNTKVQSEINNLLKQFSLLTQQEQQNLLTQAESAGRIGLQSIEAEQKKAQLLFDQYRNSFQAMGVNSSDNVLVRLMSRMLQESGIDWSTPVGEGFQKLMRGGSHWKPK